MPELITASFSASQYGKLTVLSYVNTLLHGTHVHTHKSMNLADTLAKNLRTRRGELTQEQFARKLGISRPTLTRLENGAQNTTINTLERIAKSLRCDVCELFKS